MKNIKTFKIFEREGGSGRSYNPSDSDRVYVGTMRISVEGRPRAIAYDFNPYFYVNRGQLEVATKLLSKYIDTEKYEVTSVDSIEPVERKRGKKSVGSFENWKMRNNITTKGFSFTVLDPEGNEIAKFVNMADAILYKKSVKDSTGIDCEINY